MIPATAYIFKKLKKTNKKQNAKHNNYGDDSDESSQTKSDNSESDTSDLESAQIPKLVEKRDVHAKKKRQSRKEQDTDSDDDSEESERGRAHDRNSRRTEKKTDFPTPSSSTKTKITNKREDNSGSEDYDLGKSHPRSSQRKSKKARNRDPSKDRSMRKQNRRKYSSGGNTSEGTFGSQRDSDINHKRNSKKSKGQSSKLDRHGNNSEKALNRDELTSTDNDERNDSIGNESFDRQDNINPKKKSIQKKNEFKVKEEQLIKEFQARLNFNNQELDYQKDENSLSFSNQPITSSERNVDDIPFKSRHPKEQKEKLPDLRGSSRPRKGLPKTETLPNRSKYSKQASSKPTQEAFKRQQPFNSSGFLSQFNRTNRMYKSNPQINKSPAKEFQQPKHGHNIPPLQSNQIFSRKNKNYQSNPDLLDDRNSPTTSRMKPQGHQPINEHIPSSHVNKRSSQGRPPLVGKPDFSNTHRNVDIDQRFKKEASGSNRGSFPEHEKSNIMNSERPTYAMVNTLQSSSDQSTHFQSKNSGYPPHPQGHSYQGNGTDRTGNYMSSLPHRSASRQQYLSQEQLDDMPIQYKWFKQQENQLQNLNQQHQKQQEDFQHMQSPEIRQMSLVHQQEPKSFSPDRVFAHLNTLGYFYPSVSRGEAENLLRDYGREDGTFLIRKSQAPNAGLVLSVLIGLIVKHFVININSRGEYHLDQAYDEAFSAIPDLLAHLRRNKINDMYILSVPLSQHSEDKNVMESDSPLTDNWFIDATHLHIDFGRELGSGKYGVVYKGTLEGGIAVAVKTIRDTTYAALGDLHNFGRETEMLKHLRHPRLTRFFGITTLPGNRTGIIMEYLINGNLLEYLWDVRKWVFALKDNKKAAFATEIAEGMAYLEKQRVVHRDLAARNILLSQDMTIKISDFGLSRFLKEDEEIIRDNSHRPLRWMAPESLIEKKFSSKSDAWSYGVLLLEIYTLGDCPYPELNDDEVLQKIVAGFRSPQPKQCPTRVYQEIMLPCWLPRPSDRPGFETILSTWETCRK